MLEYINPFVGIDGSGECLPGPYLPLGLVRLSPYTVALQKTCGYRSADPIKHFSHTHVAGTGGMSRYGNIGVLPFTGALRLHVDPFERRDEQAACSYYAVTTATAGIQCELTWSLSQLGSEAGDVEAALRLGDSAKKLWNLWRPDVAGFAPRANDGTWHAPFAADYARCDSWNDPYFYEGSSREWSWNSQHDFAGLMQHMGGADAFVAALDTFLQPDEAPRPPYAAGTLWQFARYRSKETLLYVPYLYHYAGRPDRSEEKVQWAMERFFQATRDGLHDNEDMGCQSTFYLCAALGLAPIFGQDIYWLTTPIFSRSDISVGAAGQRLVIEAPGAGPDRPYIARATLSGRTLDHAWLRHVEIAQGACFKV